MELMIRKGSMADVESYIRLLHEVRSGMVQKEWLFLDSPEEIREMMASGAMKIWVAVENDRLAGAFSLLIPGLEMPNYGRELGFSNEALLKVIHMDTAVVAADYRGRGLQRKLIRTAEAELSGKGERILLTTVHPDNSYSLNNAKKLGYVTQKEVPMYGSTRYILRKNIF